MRDLHLVLTGRRLIGWLSLVWARDPCIASLGDRALLLRNASPAGAVDSPTARARVSFRVWLFDGRTQ